MDIYSLLRPLLFRLDPELGHNFSLKALAAYHSAGVPIFFGNKRKSKPVSVIGLSFPNPVGLAAGMDKNGDYINPLSALGFGFIEIGTVTPLPQPGNPKQRLFRLPQAGAIINRMGFNNKGVDYLIDRVKKSNYNGILGINLGKNFDTPIEHAASDYLIGLKKVYPYASYVTINISSPNTKNLRQLQQQQEMRKLLDLLKNEQQSLHQIHGKYVPIAVKIAPDLSEQQVTQIANLLLDFEIDGVIATNTTVSRVGVEDMPYANEIGGLSGAPLKNIATQTVSWLHSVVKEQIPIIGTGGIMNGRDALDKFEAGAKLVQLYTGLVYQGPGLVKKTIDYLNKVRITQSEP